MVSAEDLFGNESWELLIVPEDSRGTEVLMYCLRITEKATERKYAIQVFVIRGVPGGEVSLEHFLRSKLGSRLM
jgi:hypothetical protein